MVKKKECKQEIHNHNYAFNWGKFVPKFILYFFGALLLFMLIVNLITAGTNNLNYNHNYEINTKYMFNECVDSCEVKDYPTNNKCINECVNFIKVRYYTK